MIMERADHVGSNNGNYSPEEYELLPREKFSFFVSIQKTGKTVYSGYRGDSSFALRS